MASFNQVYVQCPFYKDDDGMHRVTCEGIIEDSSLTLYYRKKRDYKTQINVFCCEHYTNCEVYRMLMDKYDEEDH